MYYYYYNLEESSSARNRYPEPGFYPVQVCWQLIYSPKQPSSGSQISNQKAAKYKTINDVCYHSRIWVNLKQLQEPCPELIAFKNLKDGSRPLSLNKNIASKSLQD